MSEKRKEKTRYNTRRKEKEAGSRDGRANKERGICTQAGELPLTPCVIGLTSRRRVAGVGDARRVGRCVASECTGALSLTCRVPLVQSRSSLASVEHVTASLRTPGESADREGVRERERYTHREGESSPGIVDPAKQLRSRSTASLGRCVTCGQLRSSACGLRPPCLHRRCGGGNWQAAGERASQGAAPVFPVSRLVYGNWWTGG